LIIKVNGSDEEVSGEVSLKEFLDMKGITARRALVTLNGKVLTYEDFPSVYFKEGDFLELFTFVGGG
jgi:thiamine biosynthesis protein ThiS